MLLRDIGVADGIVWNKQRVILQFDPVSVENKGYLSQCQRLEFFYDQMDMELDWIEPAILRDEEGNATGVLVLNICEGVADSSDFDRGIVRTNYNYRLEVY